MSLKSKEQKWNEIKCNVFEDNILFKNAKNVAKNKPNTQKIRMTEKLTFFL